MRGVPGVDNSRKRGTKNPIAEDTWVRFEISQGGCFEYYGVRERFLDCPARMAPHHEIALSRDVPSSGGEPIAIDRRGLSPIAPRQSRRDLLGVAWYFAEPEAAERARKLFESDPRLRKIKVIYEPAEVP